MAHRTGSMTPKRLAIFLLVNAFYYVGEFVSTLINPHTRLFRLVWGGLALFIAYHFLAKFW
jgi:hypothetical protein